MITPQDFNK